MIEDKISITPFYKVVDSVGQLYGSLIKCKVTKKMLLVGLFVTMFFSIKKNQDI